MNRSDWAAPSVQDLKNKLIFFVDQIGSSKLMQRTERAYDLISTKYTWRNVAERWHQFFDEVIANRERFCVSMKTIWNKKCGIAEFSRLQCEAMKSMVDFKIYPSYGHPLIAADEPYV